MADSPHDSGRVLRVAEAEERAYAGTQERPLGSYLAIEGAYGAFVAALVALLWRSGGRLPERIGMGDLVLSAVATHKISRLLAKDTVTSPLRAPFTRFKGASGDAELAEEVRGVGPRHAVGELLTCPFCLGQWVATAMVFGLVVAPRATRLLASVFATVTGSDVLQLAYAWAQQRAEG